MFVIVTRDQCNFCDSAKAILKGSNTPYVEYNVQSPENRWMLRLVKAAGYTTVPQIWKRDGSYIGGYTELKQLLTEG